MGPSATVTDSCVIVEMHVEAGQTCKRHSFADVTTADVTRADHSPGGKEIKGVAVMFCCPDRSV